MRRFPERLVGANRAIWVAIAGHPFVLGLTHSTLPAVAPRTWVQQDRIFMLEERRVVAAPVWESCRSGQAWPG